MKIVYVKTSAESSNYVVHGLGLLSAIAQQHGHESWWFNPHAPQQLSLVGISRAAITCCSEGFSAAVHVARQLKRVGVEVWVGGPHPTFRPKEFVEAGCFDYIVRGEGEVVWDMASAGVRFPTPVIAGDSPADLDSLPFADRRQEIDYWAHGERPPPILSAKHPPPHRCVLAGRGCRFNCAFCKPGTDLLFGKRTRRRTVANVLAEIDGLNGCGSLFVHDDNLLEDRVWLEEFAKGWSERGSKPWMMQARADLVTRRFELLKTCKEAGLAAVIVGFESGSDAVLSRMRKGCTLQHNKEAAEMLHWLGIDIQANVMFGNPGETKEDVLATLAMIKEHLFPCVVSPAVFTPYPGSEWGDQLEKDGLSAVKDHDFSRYIGGRKLDEKAMGYTYDWLYGEMERFWRDNEGEVMGGLLTRARQ